MEKVLDLYKQFGDLDIGKLKDDGLLKLECDKDGKPIPITVYDPGDKMTVCIGQLNDKNELNGIGRMICVCKTAMEEAPIVWEIYEGQFKDHELNGFGRVLR